MGCGQSKIGIYQRKSKNKKNGSKRSGDGGQSEEEAEEAEDRVGTEAKESTEECEGDNVSDSVTTKIKQMAQQQTGGAILAQSDISSSQLDFFKMLDEKIENGPDYEEADEEEEKQRLANLLKEWRVACQARQLRKNGPAVNDQENWPSPVRGKTYVDDYGSYQNRVLTAVDTQRFPTGYSQVPPNNSINIHLQNSFRSVAPPYTDQPRMPMPRPPYPNPNFHPYQPQPEAMNHSDESAGHPLSTSEPPNPLRTNYPPQILMRQSSMNSQIQHYPPENQRLYNENIRQFPDSPRVYPDQRPYAVPRNIQTINVLHEQRLYLQDGGNRPYPYQDGPPRQQSLDQQRIMMGPPYHDPQNPRILPDNQRIYHERLLENQRQYPDNTRPMGNPVDGQQRPHPQFQRPPLISQRSFQEPSRIYRDLDSEEQCFQRQFPDSLPDGASPRVHNQSHFKMGRSLSVDVQYVAGPPPPREMIPLQGAPGPPQGSPRPMVARGLQMNMHRMPANSVVQFRKPRGAFTELA